MRYLALTLLPFLAACDSTNHLSVDAAPLADMAPFSDGLSQLPDSLNRTDTDSSPFVGTFSFDTDRDVATAYFSWSLMRYGWPALYFFGKSLAECGGLCPNLTVDGDRTTIEATAECAKPSRMTILRGSMTRTAISGGERFTFNDFEMKVDGDFIGVKANGTVERLISEGKSPEVERLLVADQLAITQYGPWTPWNNNAYPGSEAISIIYRNVDHTRTIHQDRVDDLFSAVVEVPGRGSFRVTGSWHWNLQSECSDDEPWQGQLVVEGKRKLTFTFDGKTACDRRIPFAYPDGKQGSVILDGNVPVFGPSCE